MVGGRIAVTIVAVMAAIALNSCETSQQAAQPRTQSSVPSQSTSSSSPPPSPINPPQASRPQPTQPVEPPSVEKVEEPPPASIAKELSGDPEKLKSIGENYLAAGNPAMALRYLKAAEARRPKDVQLLYEIAMAYNARGFRQEAKEYLQKALAIQPDYAEASNALGAFLAEEGRFEEARRAFEKALNNPYYETPQLAAYNLGTLFYRMGNYQEAAKYYRQAIGFDPNYASAHLELARTLEALGDNEGAFNEYREALQYNPQLVQANFGYGRLLFQKGDYVAAKYYLEQVIKLAPDSSIAKAARDYLDKMGYLERKR
jgi:Tfp pilus assembly protein PilF